MPRKKSQTKRGKHKTSKQYRSKSLIETIREMIHLYIVHISKYQNKWYMSTSSLIYMTILSVLTLYVTSYYPLQNESYYYLNRMNPFHYILPSSAPTTPFGNDIHVGNINAHHQTHSNSNNNHHHHHHVHHPNNKNKNSKSNININNNNNNNNHQYCRFQTPTPNFQLNEGTVFQGCRIVPSSDHQSLFYRYKNI